MPITVYFSCINVVYIDPKCTTQYLAGYQKTKDTVYVNYEAIFVSKPHRVEWQSLKLSAQLHLTLHVLHQFR